MHPRTSTPRSCPPWAGYSEQAVYRSARWTLAWRVLQSAPIQRHLLAPLLDGAWRRRHNLRLVDALYAQLADDLGVALVTTDAGLATATANGELVEIS